MKRDINHKCEKCGYKWKGYKENPKSCPECKSRKWKKLKINTQLNSGRFKK